MSTKIDTDKPYDPDERLTADEKISLAHYNSGTMKSYTLGADGKMHEDVPPAKEE